MGKGSGQCSRTPLMLEDRRNVLDMYKGKSNEYIREDLQARRHPFGMMIENHLADFNLSTAIRNHNAFLGSSIWLSGRRSWDTRGAVGTHHYEPLHHGNSSTEIIQAQKAAGKRIVVVDEIEGAADLRSTSLDENSFFVFGQEQIGVSPAALELADEVVYVPSLGSTRSLNVGTISGITMYEYLRQQYQPDPTTQTAPSSQSWHNGRYPDIESIPTHERKGVINHRHYWEQQAEAAKRDTRQPFATVLEDVSYGFNVSTVIRNNNAFLGSDIIVTGSQRPQMEGNHQVSYQEHTQEVVSAYQQRGYEIVAFDLVDDSTCLWDYTYNPQSLLVFGQENAGVSPEILQQADRVIHIPQFGSTRSLNVGVSSGIAMYEYARQLL